jgi:hypothetical protein
MKLEKTWLRRSRPYVGRGRGFAVAVGLTYAKLPQPPMDDAAKAKAEETKVKAAEATKKAREAEEKAMDRVAERYKKEKGVKTAETVEPKKKK